jgi:hypothetical protein
MVRCWVWSIQLAMTAVLHLVDGHFRSVAMNGLNEATSLARWDLDISNLTESLEEGMSGVEPL